MYNVREDLTYRTRKKKRPPITTNQPTSTNQPPSLTLFVWKFASLCELYSIWPDTFDLKIFFLFSSLSSHEELREIEKGGRPRVNGGPEV